MILLGHLHKGHGRLAGSTTQRPTDAREQELTSVDAGLAEEQLECMKAYLLQVNWLFAWSLTGSASRLGLKLENPKRAEQYARAEPNALGISSTKNQHRLVVDKPTATQHRFGSKTTWIFDRLLDLAKSRIPVEVWDTGGGGDASGQEGADFEGWDWNGENAETDRDEPRPGAKAKRVWVMKRNSDPTRRGSEYTAKPRMRRGETYIHELVIHAWRTVNFGHTPIDESDLPKSWGKTERFLRSNHHRAFPHMPIDDDSHNLADIEADLLTLYLTWNQDWASFRLHNPTDILPDVVSGMKPKMNVRGGKWVSEQWIRQQIQRERKKRQGQARRRKALRR